MTDITWGKPTVRVSTSGVSYRVPLTGAPDEDVEVWMRREGRPDSVVSLDHAGKGLAEIAPNVGETVHSPQVRF